MVSPGVQALHCGLGVVSFMQTNLRVPRNVPGEALNAQRPDFGMPSVPHECYYIPEGIICLIYCTNKCYFCLHLLKSHQLRHLPIE